MLFILVLVILFHVTTTTLVFVATIHNAWWVVSPRGYHVIYTDLWYSCNKTCIPVAHSHTTKSAYLQTVQATMILSAILCCVSFFVFILQLFRLKQGERFVFTAIIQLLAGLSVMIGASVYTAQKKSFHTYSLQRGSYGSSFILAWIAVPMTFMSGLMYIILRKRK